MNLIMRKYYSRKKRDTLNYSEQFFQTEDSTFQLLQSQEEIFMKLRAQLIKVLHFAVF